MMLLIVDDATENGLLSKSSLERVYGGDIVMASSAEAAGAMLNNYNFVPELTPVDLILVDLPGTATRGLETCRRLRAMDYLKEVPIIVITNVADMVVFAGQSRCEALDFLRKPVDSIELQARVSSALRLKNQMDKRRQITAQFQEVQQHLRRMTEELQTISTTDDLTNTANRRSFEENLLREWKRAMRNEATVSLILLEIDYFKHFNQYYGYTAGDVCLKSVALAMRRFLRRPADFLARYDCGVFAVILPETDTEGTYHVAKALHEAITVLQIPHETSAVADHITVSAGFSTALPSGSNYPTELQLQADTALSLAKESGGNRVMYAQVVKKAAE